VAIEKIVWISCDTCLHPGEATKASQDENDVGNTVSFLKKILC